MLAPYIEIDFQGGGGNERVSSSFNPRLRHAFMTFQDFTIGQTWSTFFNVGTLPENLDFVGPVGTIFERQPQIRYSPGNWDFALENPESTVYDNADDATSYDDNRMPDMVARYNIPVDAGSLSIAAMGREIAYKDATQNLGDASRESAYGYGVSLAAKIPVGDDGSDIRAQLNGGNAMGRYMSLNGFRAAQIEANGDIELIDQMGGFVSYRHIWSPQWRSNLTLSHSEADNPDAVDGGAAKSYSSTHANLIYSPFPTWIWAAKSFGRTRSLRTKATVNSTGCNSPPSSASDPSLQLAPRPWRPALPAPMAQNPANPVIPHLLKVIEARLDTVAQILLKVLTKTSQPFLQSRFHVVPAHSLFNAQQRPVDRKHGRGSRNQCATQCHRPTRGTDHGTPGSAGTGTRDHPPGSLLPPRDVRQRLQLPERHHAIRQSPRGFPPPALRKTRSFRRISESASRLRFRPSSDTVSSIR